MGMEPRLSSKITTLPCVITLRRRRNSILSVEDSNCKAIVATSLKLVEEVEVVVAVLGEGDAEEMIDDDDDDEDDEDMGWAQYIKTHRSLIFSYFETAPAGISAKRLKFCKSLTMHPPEGSNSTCEGFFLHNHTPRPALL